MDKVITSAHRRQRSRRRARWWLGTALLAVLASGCQQGSQHTVQVLDSPPGSTDTAQPDPGQTPGESAPTPTSNPDTGDDPTPTSSSDTGDDPTPTSSSDTGGNPTPTSSSDTGDNSGGTAPPTGPGDDNPGPGTGPGPDGPSGPVDDDGSGDGDGSGPGIAPGEGDRPGGLRLLAPPPPYEGLADEIFDLCDDADAYAVIFARSLGPGEEMTDEERDAIAFKRQVAEVSCDEPGGRRYVYMSVVGPSGAFATVQAAVEDHNDRNRYSKESRIVRPPDLPLGYFGHLDWTFPLADIDEVVVLVDSVLVLDGVVRGLVRNLSKTLFAREVTVTARPAAGAESENNNAQTASGRFPLTVQPGERAPFEINGWTGSDDPADIDLEVSANLSTNVDITRSFGFGSGGTVTTRDIDEKFFKNFVPDFVYQAEKHKIDDDGRLMIELISAGLTAPTSHPSLKDQVLNQTIDDLRVYMALIGNGKIYDIVEPPMFVSARSALHPHFYPQAISLPTIFNGAPFYDYNIVFIPEYSWHMWVGEPGPLDFNPRTLPEIGPPVPLPVQPPVLLPEQEEPPSPP